MYCKSIHLHYFKLFLKKMKLRVIIKIMEITLMTVRDKPRSSKVQF